MVFITSLFMEHLLAILSLDNKGPLLRHSNYETGLLRI